MRIASVFSKTSQADDVFVLFITSRLALLLVAWLGVRLLPLAVTFPAAWQIGSEGNKRVVVTHVSPTSHPWVNMLSRRDGAWYVEIAGDGYGYQAGSASNTAFFPLYPLLIRAVHSLFFLPANDYCWLITAIVLSNDALLIGLVYLRTAGRPVHADAFAVELGRLAY